LRVRFFTPRSEAAFVGHATLAVHAVLAQREPQPQRRQAGRTGICTVYALPNEGGFAIAQAAPVLGRALNSDEIRQALDALGLASTALDARCPPRIAGSPSTRLLIGLKDGATLATLSPDLAQLSRLSPVLGAAGYFIFSTASSQPDCDVESRMFCPALGIPEDPVSGNAHGLLGAHLLQHELLTVTEGQSRFTGAQGHQPLP
jgi:PhzF family phenazine biosynthesis protein